MNHLLFLSHAGVDSEAALRLAERIESSVDAQQAGLRVFIDKPDLRTGARWKDQFQQALEASTAFAVYVGSKGVVNWVWTEVSVALDRAHADPAYPLIPVLSASANVKELPSFLSQYQGVGDVESKPEQFEHLLRGFSASRRGPRSLPSVSRLSASRPSTVARRISSSGASRKLKSSPSRFATRRW